MQNNIAVYCHSHWYEHHDFHRKTYCVATLETMKPPTAWWSLWKHSVKFPLIVLLFFSTTGKHFLYKSPQHSATL